MTATVYIREYDALPQRGKQHALHVFDSVPDYESTIVIDTSSSTGFTPQDSTRFVEVYCDNSLVYDTVDSLGSSISTGTYLPGGILGSWRVTGSDNAYYVKEYIGNEYNSLVVDYDFATHKEVHSDLTFSRASDQTYWDASGVLQTATTNVACFTHDPGDSNASLGYLSEGARTNLCLQSNAFTTTWTASGATLAADVDGPDGVTNSAWTITDDDGAANEYIEQSFTVADDSNRHTFSVHILKNAESTVHAMVELEYTVSGPTAYATIRTDTGAITTDTGFDLATVHDMGSWWRVEFGLNNDTTGHTNLNVRIYPAVTGVAGNTTGSNVFYGAQLEKAAFMSSYIATTTVGVTRAATVLNSTSIVDRFGTSEGSFAIKGRGEHGGEGTGSSAYVFQLDDSGTSDRILVRVSTAATSILSESYHSADTDGSVSHSFTDGADFGIACTYEDDNFESSLNGTSAAADTSAAFPLADAFVSFELGSRNNGNDHYFGTISRFKAWSLALSDAERDTESTV